MRTLNSNSIRKMIIHHVYINVTSIKRHVNFESLRNQLDRNISNARHIERFNETMLNAYNLFALSICHVCGSYQCPYCPFFSNAATLIPDLQARWFLFSIIISANLIMIYLATPGSLGAKMRR